MLKSLRAENYQSHRDTYVEFSPGINAFIGESDQGKSALLRVLRWIFKNRPLGGDFRSWFAEGKEVVKGELELSEGGRIVHVREGDSNFYELNGERLEAHGAEVPDVVVDALGLGPYNVSSQHDTYFLLQDSPGEVARQLNSVVKLDEIDKTSKKSKELVSKTKQDLESGERSIEKLKEDAAEFDHLPEVEKLVTDLVGRHGELEEVSGRRIQLSSCLTKLDGIDVDIEDLDGWLKVEGPYEKLRAKVDRASEVKDRASRLGALLGDLENDGTGIEGLNDFLEAESRLGDIFGSIDERVELNRRKNALSGLLFQIEDGEKRAVAKENQVLSLSDRYLEGAEELGICPVCFTKIGRDQIAHIREHIDG